MDCDDCLERLYTFLDKELGPGEIAEMTKHLAGCGDCDSNLRFEERFLKILRDCGTADVAPAALRERLLKRLRSVSPPVS